MAAIVGKDGSIRIGANVIGYIDTWSLSPVNGTAEITAFGESARQYTYTLKDWTCNASGSLDKTDAQQITLSQQTEAATLAVVALRLCVSATGNSYWGGNAYVKSMAVNSSVGDKVSITFDFQGTGNLTFTTT
ncbi:MAG: hypothetical protein WC455_14035 [Dehalococcoidia bacterium]|jgi:hypothetical protein